MTGSGRKDLARDQHSYRAANVASEEQATVEGRTGCGQ
jgi:hypothetical protein